VVNRIKKAKPCLNHLYHGILIWVQKVTDEDSSILIQKWL
jgi:hypothetical protein